MADSLQLLQETSTALRDALANQDWMVMGELDLQCRLAIDSAMIEHHDEAQLRDSMESLLSLYRELVTACQAEQQRLAGELVQLNHSRQGAKVYQLFG